MLFSIRKRTNKRPQLFSESTYTFLDTSGRVIEEKIRNLLEEWFERYPSCEKNRFLKDFQTDNSYSAFFELYLHELLFQLGYKIDPHPKILDKKQTHPDFLVTDSCGLSFYLEATIVTGKSKKERDKEQLIYIIYDEINKLEFSKFYIGMNIDKKPKGSFSVRKLKKFLVDKMKNIDYDDICEKYKHNDSSLIPRWRYLDKGLEIEFYPIPKKLGYSNIIGNEIKFVDRVTHVLKSLKKKTNRYGDFDRPFLIAINVLDYAFETKHMLDVLFGKQYFIFPYYLSNDIRSGRKSNGIWTYNQNRRLSAILLCKEITPWTVISNNLWLYLNPWAKIHCSGPITRLSQFIPVNGEMKEKPGEQLHKILNLPKNWLKD